ncbi:hypothetical protein PCC8801_1132 [Rippkaea orientalis PCC 8801]|uniref:Uncharacterized protein n=1 Tax=Rippkaea orientalis (strain PCC 8801 / RF-1) TaxID=41431 RepID=B7K266_RIPO1|nr:hypothetical protein PCC8801_1132 [Rippkaea orientalis PCC 8801]
MQVFCYQSTGITTYCGGVGEWESGGVGEWGSGGVGEWGSGGKYFAFCLLPSASELLPPNSNLDIENSLASNQSLDR